MKFKPEDLRAMIAPGFCDRIAVLPLDRGWSILTPFHYADGDAYPVILEQRGSGWRLTDRGAAAEQLIWDEYEWSEAKQERLRRFVEQNGAQLSKWEIYLDVDKLTSAAVADFVKVLASVTVLPVVDDERKQERFRTVTRDAVTGRLPAEWKAISNWSPSSDKRKLYKADLHLNPAAGSPGEPIVAFFAGTPAAASTAATTILRYREWGLRERPIALVRQDSSISSDTVYRLQDVLQDDKNVIRVRPGDVEPAVKRLRQLGVPA